MTSYSLTNLYKAHEPDNLPKFNPNLNKINLTEFSLETKSDVVHIACVIGLIPTQIWIHWSISWTIPYGHFPRLLSDFYEGSVNCVNKWKPLLTPMGVCHKLELFGDADYQKIKPLKQSNSVLGLIVGVNLRNV